MQIRSAGFGSYLRDRRAEMAAPGSAVGERLSRRQVPGLRREELAKAAGISVEYYIRLEQGRAAHPSRGVIADLARALHLGNAERDHLFLLAGEPPPPPVEPAEVVRPGLLRLLRGLGDSVAVTVHDGRLNALARNAAATELLGSLPPAGGSGRSIVRQGFEPEARRLLGDEGADHYARWVTAELRVALGRYPEDDQLRSLVGELSSTHAAFRSHWERGEVASQRSGVKRVRHPKNGWLTFQSEMFHDAERDHWIVLYAPAS